MSSVLTKTRFLIALKEFRGILLSGMVFTLDEYNRANVVKKIGKW